MCLKACLAGEEETREGNKSLGWMSLSGPTLIPC